MKNNQSLTLILYSLIFFSLVIFTGTITSGFHLTDDHGILGINESINKYGLYNSIKTEIIADFNSRFRPMYHLHRVLAIFFFGTDFYALSIINLILYILSSFFLFRFCSIIGLNRNYAFLFPLLLFIGPQSAILWRLGTNENIGIFFFSISLFFLVKAVKQKSLLNKAFAIITIAFSSLSKESFILVLPAYVILYIWLLKKFENTFTLTSLVKKNIFSILFLCIYFIGEIIFIKLFVGTNKIGYAGIDDSLNFYSFMSRYFQNIIGKGIYILYFIFCFFSILFFFDVSKKSMHQFVSVNKIDLFFVFAFSILVVFPQLILYFKSGLFERYLLPLMIGIYFPVIYFLNLTHNIILSKGYLFLTTIFILVFTSFLLKKTVLLQALDFTAEGKETFDAFTFLKNNSTRSDTILVICDPVENNEWSYSCKRYLNLVNKNNNVNFLINRKESSTSFNDYLNVTFKSENNNILVEKPALNFAAIIVLPFAENRLLCDSLIPETNFLKNQFGRFAIYIRKKV